MACRLGVINFWFMGVFLKIIVDIGGWKKFNIVEWYFWASGMDSVKLVKKFGFFD